MKNQLKIILILFCVITSAQVEKQELIRESLKPKRDSLLLISLSDIVKSINTQDQNLMGDYIDPQIGIYSFRDSKGEYDFIRKINFSSANLNRLPKEVLNANIKFENASEYDCAKQKWSSIGVLVDTVNIHKPFSEIIRNNNTDKHADLDISIISVMENNSRRIIISQKHHNSFVLYLGFYREKWWITFFDLRESYCN